MQIPTQALNNVFHHQDINGVRMLLSNNPWKCDCNTISQFQVIYYVICFSVLGISIKKPCLSFSAVYCKTQAAN